jgi:hypothetical protein
MLLVRIGADMGGRHVARWLVLVVRRGFDDVVGIRLHTKRPRSRSAANPGHQLTDRPLVVRRGFGDVVGIRCQEATGGSGLLRTRVVN